MITTSAICPMIYYLYTTKSLASTLPPQIKTILENFKHMQIPRSFIGEDKLSSESKHLLAVTIKKQDFENMKKDQFWHKIREKIDEEFQKKPDYAKQLFDFWKNRCTIVDFPKLFISMFDELKNEQMKEQTKFGIEVTDKKGNKKISYSSKLADEAELLIAKNKIYSDDDKVLSLEDVAYLYTGFECKLFNAVLRKNVSILSMDKLFYWQRDEKKNNIFKFRMPAAEFYSQLQKIRILDKYLHNGTLGKSGLTGTALWRIVDIDKLEHMSKCRNISNNVAELFESVANFKNGKEDHLWKKIKNSLIRKSCNGMDDLSEETVLSDSGFMSTTAGDSPLYFHNLSKRGVIIKINWNDMIPGLPLDHYNSIDKDKVFKGQEPDAAREFLLPSNCKFTCTSIGLYDGKNPNRGEGGKCLEDCLQVNLSCKTLKNLVPESKLFSERDVRATKSKIEDFLRSSATAIRSTGAAI